MAFLLTTGALALETVDLSSLESTIAEVETEAPEESAAEEAFVQMAEAEQKNEKLLAASGNCGEKITWSLSDDGVFWQESGLGRCLVCTVCNKSFAEEIRDVDINGDGIIGTADLIVLMKHLVGAEEAANKDALDVNGDGAVNLSDAVCLVRYLA